MQSITTIGLDIAKSVFQVHGVDGAGRVVKTALRFLLIKPRCFLDKVRNRLLGHPQPCRTKMVAEKVEAAFDLADEGPVLLHRYESAHGTFRTPGDIRPESAK